MFPADLLLPRIKGVLSILMQHEVHFVTQFPRLLVFVHMSSSSTAAMSSLHGCCRSFGFETHWSEITLNQASKDQWSRLGFVRSFRSDWVRSRYLAAVQPVQAVCLVDHIKTFICQKSQHSWIKIVYLKSGIKYIHDFLHHQGPKLDLQCDFY